MISLRRPSQNVVAAYRDARLNREPTCRPHATVPAGFRHDTFSRSIGGAEVFGRARIGLQQWAAHRGSGVDVFPDDVRVIEGETVAIVTRQLGLWVLACCRIEVVVDAPGLYGFTYSTLPDHPECGYEFFHIRVVGDDVAFEIEAISRPGIPVVRFGSPVTRRLQRRATNAYLGALARFTEGSS